MPNQNKLINPTDHIDQSNQSNSKQIVHLTKSGRVTQVLDWEHPILNLQEIHKTIGNLMVLKDQKLIRIMTSSIIHLEIKMHSHSRKMHPCLVVESDAGAK